MKNHFSKFLLACNFIAVSVSVSAQSDTKLLLIGGGVRASELVSRFVGEAGGPKAKILIITWATSEPDKVMAQYKAQFKTSPTVEVGEAERSPLNSETREKFLLELRNFTGVFFTGGNQNSMTPVLSDPIVRGAIKHFYNSGKIVGGSSAGTAIMSPAMFTGEGSQLAPGLGLLPGTLVDTHFGPRKRIKRLSQAQSQYPQLIGLGIDEDNAIWITGGHHVEVIGPTHLTVVKTDSSGNQDVKLFNNGQTLDLQNLD